MSSSISPFAASRCLFSASACPPDARHPSVFPLRLLFASCVPRDVAPHAGINVPPPTFTSPAWWSPVTPRSTGCPFQHPRFHTHITGGSSRPPHPSPAATQASHPLTRTSVSSSFRPLHFRHIDLISRKHGIMPAPSDYFEGQFIFVCEQVSFSAPL